MWRTSTGGQEKMYLYILITCLKTACFLTVVPDARKSPHINGAVHKLLYTHFVVCATSRGLKLPIC